ncbi:putative HTH-type transcriptional regulator YdcR [compost metagenome]
MLKYMELLNELEIMMESPPYQDGQKLPSIRVLAQQHSCSKSTVIKALAELEKRHKIYTLPKSGTYVVQKTKPAELEKSLFVDFAASAPDPDVFPYLDFQHCINKAIDTYKKDLFIYGTPQGLPSLIQIIHKQLANYQVFASPRHIFIVSGVQQALSLLATMPFPNGKSKILIEQPGYHLFIDYLQTHEHPVVGIQRTTSGIDLQELERIFRTEDIKFFYTMPRFHNPLGSSYTHQQKKKIAALAQQYDVYLVEDDYLADLEQDSKADPLYAYDSSSHVIYLKSYSKIIFPGLRIGVAVLPEALIEVFSHYKRLHDIDSSMLSQGALEIYLKSGMFERHKQKIRTSYTRRASILANSIQKYEALGQGRFSFAPMKHPCIHTHLILNSKLPATWINTLVSKAAIRLEPIDSHYLTDFPKQNLLKLNVSNVKDEMIELGIQQLAEKLGKLAL